MDVSFPVLCIIVCLGRIIDVSLGTTRTIFSVKNKPHIAALIGFAEAVIWFLIVRAALAAQLAGVETYIIALSYALGFSLGTYCGGLFSSKVITNKIKVQIITTSKDDTFVAALSGAGFGATILTGKGASNNEEKYVIFIETDNKKLKLLRSIIDQYDKNAFVSVADTKRTYNGYFGK